MSEWIRVRAEEIRQAERERKAERDRQIAAANILKAKIEPFWRELVEVIASSVKVFNQEFPEADRRIDSFERPSHTAFVMRRAIYPAVTVKAQLNSAGTSVQFSISRTHRKGTEPLEKQGSFTFGIVEGDVAYIESGINGHEDVARLFLDPFFAF
jgi:hypothetical protein